MRQAIQNLPKPQMQFAETLQPEFSLPYGDRLKRAVELGLIAHKHLSKMNQPKPKMDLHKNPAYEALSRLDPTLRDTAAQDRPKNNKPE